MISSVEALDYRCLHYVSEPLDPFHVLVGPDNSGKTTFLDAIAFVGDLVSAGLDYAVNERTRNFSDLVWRRSGESFQITIEASMPEERRPGHLVEARKHRQSVAHVDFNRERFMVP